MFHADGGGGRPPTRQQPVGGIDDAQSLRTDAYFPDETRRDVHAMNTSADDEPVERHSRCPSDRSARRSVSTPRSGTT